MPRDYEKAFAGTWESATVKDLCKAAEDLPGMNFEIYHSALGPSLADRPSQRATTEKEFLPFESLTSLKPELFSGFQFYSR